MKFHELKNNQNIENWEEFVAAWKRKPAQWECKTKADQDQLIAWIKVRLYFRWVRRVLSLSEELQGYGVEIDRETLELKLTPEDFREMAEAGHAGLLREAFPKLAPYLKLPKRKHGNREHESNSVLRWAMVDDKWARKYCKKELGGCSRKYNDPDRIRIEFIVADFWGLEEREIRAAKHG